jgi:hypothetical protein
MIYQNISYIAYDWCKNKRKLKYDFSIEKYKIIIELDGRQHFKKISNWTDPHKTQKLDLLKMDRAKKNKFTIIRLLQEDVWNDTIDWKSILKEKIKYYNYPCRIFIDSNNEYKCFTNKMSDIEISNNITRINSFSIKNQI